MRLSELLAQLQEELNTRGDREVTVSVDISTGDADLEARAFGEIIELMRDGNELVLLATGETNLPKKKK
jgi:hypothetical protein